jgi:hypothetical protein
VPSLTPVFWNRLGSATQKNRSDISTATGVASGTEAYAACKFGGGSDYSAAADHTDYTGFDSVNRDFSIDFWFIIPTNTTTNTRVHIIRSEAVTAGAGIIVYLYVDLRTSFLNEIGLMVWPNYSNNTFRIIAELF